jgi:hypothetical protein
MAMSVGLFTCFSFRTARMIFMDFDWGSELAIVTATRLRAGQPRYLGSLPGKDEGFSLHSIQTSSGAMCTHISKLPLNLTTNTSGAEVKSIPPLSYTSSCCGSNLSTGRTLPLFYATSVETIPYFCNNSMVDTRICEVGGRLVPFAKYGNNRTHVNHSRPNKKLVTIITATIIEIRVQSNELLKFYEMRTLRTLEVSRSVNACENCRLKKTVFTH